MTGAPLDPRLAAVALVVLLVAGCATGSGWQWPWSGNGAEEEQPEPEAPVSAEARLDRGIQALEAGEYATASTRLARLASRCESGRPGRRAVLLLAGASLDPRNPDASPDRGARLAAHVLGLPGSDPTERALSETLYLLALDRGGEPPGEGAPSDSEETGADGYPAPRFYDCDAVAGDTGQSRSVALPRLPGTPSAEVLSRTRGERDFLQSRVVTLQAELDRIRELLREGILPDTTPPDTVSPDTSDLPRR